MNRLKGFEKWAAHSAKFFWEYSPRTYLIPYVWHICELVNLISGQLKTVSTIYVVILCSN